MDVGLAVGMVASTGVGVGSIRGRQSGGMKGDSGWKLMLMEVGQKTHQSQKKSKKHTGLYLFFSRKSELAEKYYCCFPTHGSLESN